jgi:hypothetical protein
MGAVNKPDALTVPDVAAHATVVFEVLLTVAINCWVFPETTVAVEGDAQMLTPFALGDELPPPQAVRTIRPDSIRHAGSNAKPRNPFWSEFFPSRRETSGTGGQSRCAIPVQSSRVWG